MFHQPPNSKKSIENIIQEFIPPVPIEHIAAAMRDGMSCMHVRYMTKAELEKEYPMETVMNRNELHKAIIEEAAKSTSTKRKVGAAVVAIHGDDDFQILSLGHNHRPGGGPLEYSNEHSGKMVTYEDVIHAEQDALNKVDRNAPPWSVVPNGVRIGMFVTHDPCDGCLAAIKQDNISIVEVVGDFLKFDTNKLRYDLVPPSAIAGLAEVLTYGAKKYKPNNWRKVKDPERYIAAAMRHFEAYRSGEEFDPESGLPHLAQAMTNLAFLYELNFIPERITNDE